LEEYNGIAGDDVYLASREELKEVAQLLAEDEELGGPYGFDLLYKQLLERYDDGFGRSWIRKDETGVISHSATYAENEDLAVISGSIVRPDHRGRGEFAGQLGATCRDLHNEGKEVIFECEGLEYIASSGLRILINILKATMAKGNRVVLRNVNDDIKNVFKLTGFLNIFEFE
jgi:ABC-type transporter Mla MlaB component